MEAMGYEKAGTESGCEEKAANFPAQMVENIAKGRLNKFFKESTLEEQEYTMSDD